MLVADVERMKSAYLDITSKSRRELEGPEDDQASEARMKQLLLEDRGELNNAPPAISKDVRTRKVGPRPFNKILPPAIRFSLTLLAPQNSSF